MKSTILTAVLLIISNIAFGQLPADRIKAIIKQEVASKRSKSIIVGIIDANGRQIFAEGQISDNDSRLPDENTMYEIGSITKVFTSLSLADMSLKRQLNLNDPISKFLPARVKTPVKNEKEISLISLSTHRSGMPRFPFNVDPKDLNQPYRDYTTEKLYQYVSTFEPQYDIDSKWRYSNIAYGLLGNILMIISKKDFETLIVEEICKPLHMNNTVVRLTAAQKSNLAVGHAETGTPVGLTDLGAIGPGGALRSNVNDLLTFTAANLGLTTSTLQSAMELSHVMQAKKDGNDTFTTMGWTLTGDGNLLFKDGGMPGYCTFLGIDKKNKTGVVVLSNSNNPVTDIGRHILDSTYQMEPYRYKWTLLDTLRATYRKTSLDSTMKLYQKLKLSKNPSLVFNVYQLNYLGEELRRAKKTKDAIKVFDLNVKEYPEATLAYESLGESLRRNHQKEKAISCFEKASELEPDNLHWTYILRRLKPNERPTSPPTNF